ncbi:RHS repeat protein [Lacibacter luteus]|uniref:RHS repeat protein n=1 Tax=Lacibacter luteus TaxID=2508719 RepID=A0A4Q1CJX3_9BACT|nr:DUF6531 domain-containing protein [Lacibacter luteus]RXK60632.1 RHS repeat protein [Lacibacter luteus]
MIRTKQVLTALLFFITVSATAGVNIKNGNFYISYTDHDLARFNGMEIMRTYNSKSSEKGLFGIGWGSEIETRLYMIGDGHVLIKEFGAGSPNQFSPAETNEALITQCINQLVKAALQNEDIENNPAAINQFRREMRNNLEARFRKWLFYTDEGLLKPPVITEYSKWESQDLGYQQLTKTTAGFKRTNDDGSYDLFNNRGLFIGRYKADGRLVYSISYNAANRIAQLKDKGGNIFTFTTNKDGRVISIKSRQGTSFYWYEGLALVKTKDIANNTYRHSYDSSFNMTGIHYTNGASMLIEYETTTFFCKKVTEPNGNVSMYEYKTFFDAEGNVNDNHYATLVLSLPKGSVKADSAYYEYEIRDKPDGSSYIYHFIYKKNSELFEELNNEQCEMPDHVLKANMKHLYTYNSNCIPVTYENDTILVKAEIDTAWNKASRMLTTDKRTNSTKEKKITYNSSGNPVRMQEDTVTTTITYSASQKVTRIKQGQTELIYKYDSFDQLSTVTSTGTGELLFVYDKEGALLRKESKKGKATADVIEAAYNRLEKYIAQTGILFDY